MGDRWRHHPWIGPACLASLGLATSALAYYGLERERAAAPFSDAAEYIALDDGRRPGSLGGERPGAAHVSSTDYPLSRPGWLTARTASEDGGPEAQRTEVLSDRFFGVTLRILDPPGSLPWERMLLRGRAPIAGRAEAAAGAGVAAGPVEIGHRPYQVVGWFRPEIAALRRSVVAYGSPTLAAALAGARPSRSVLIEGTHRAPAAPPSVMRILHPRRLGAIEFLLYMAGVAALYTGGCIIVWRAVQRLARRDLPRVLADSLAFLAGRRRRFLWLSASFFGTVSLLNLVTYFLPDVQGFTWSLAEGLVHGGTGTLGWAGRAYASGSVVKAASATLLINFAVGTVRDITLPSAIVPGIGAVLGLLRAGLWGVTLSPSTAPIAGKLKLVELLEGEGYVIAMVFAAEMAVALRAARGTRLRSYGAALLVNAKGLSLVALVLAAAALVEAVTVLLAR